ncbi:MAG: hypothetical protein HQL60_04700 [Magnetococcales bacterium]|nr:hypothetical protein [Magnetococcales bacterium]
MSRSFFEQPVLNGPYSCPSRHWELDPDGQPSGRLLESRRVSSYVTPVPKPAHRRGGTTAKESRLQFEEVSTGSQEYDPTPIINKIRDEVAYWRQIPDPRLWQVTPETARLLQHWRHHPFQGIRPFFCQLEAVETAIWLAEVAPKTARWAHDHLQRANEQANPNIFRMA